MNIIVNPHFILETTYGKLTFMKQPTQVKKLAELPNWFINLVKKDGLTMEKIYVNIQQDSMTPPSSVDELHHVVDELMPALVKNKLFVLHFGELAMDGRVESLTGIPKNFRVAQELYNFFQRRGRNTKSVLEASTSKKFNPITLSLDSDVTFKTTSSHSNFRRNYKCISGTVFILGQHHHFELSHPLFDLSMMMTAGDARKNITSGLRKAFPFITGESSIHGWTFDNQVQGK